MFFSRKGLEGREFLLEFPDVFLGEPHSADFKNDAVFKLAERFQAATAAKNLTSLELADSSPFSFRNRVDAYLSVNWPCAQWMLSQESSP